MNKSIKNAAQGGFTLIELIVVIVILGILAATALPKFADMGTDARIATLNAAKGSLNSVAAMVHGKALVNPAATTVTMEGAVVDLKNGYPAVTNSANFQAAAGLGEYTIVAPGASATANLPAATATQVAFVPASVASSPKGLTCYVMYNEAADANTPPVVAVTSTGC